MFKLLKERKITSYLLNMKKRYQKYGLKDFNCLGVDFDYNSYVSFNKEKLVREIVKEQRAIDDKRRLISGEPLLDEHREISDEERIFALAKILIMCDDGLVNKTNMERI